MGLLALSLCCPVGSSWAEEIGIVVDAATEDGTLSTWFEPSMFATYCPPDMLQEFLNDAGGMTGGMVRLGVDNVLGSSTSLSNYVQRLDASNLNERVQAVSDAGGQVLIGITKTPLWITSYTGSPLEKVCNDWYRFQTFAPAADKWDDWQMAAYETVKHFSIDMDFDHVTYEFWTEPNHLCFWADTQANFLAMWKYTVWGAEPADPNVRLGGCAPASPGARLEGETEPILRTFIEYSAGQALDLDVATYHYFGPQPRKTGA